MTLAPARLAPVFLPRIWGARNLAPLFDPQPLAASLAGEPIGEVWLTGDRCEFASGPFAGRSLGESWPNLSAEWTGTRFQGLPRIPLLVKFIFPEDKLSVQVHPDDAYAREHERAAGGVGKTEMWYAVAARACAQLRLGLRPGTTPNAFRQAIADGTAEESLSPLPVRAGDAFFVPAGTAHTIGPGLVLCEVQQNSDITYRVYDYNRVAADGKSRPLHIRQALEVMRFGETGSGPIDPVTISSGSLRQAYLVACRYFAVELWEFAQPIAAATGVERFELLIPLAGEGCIESNSSSAPYRPAQLWILPAALGAYRLAPNSATTLLRAYVPDLGHLAAQLAGQQVSETARRRLIHP